MGEKQPSPDLPRTPASVAHRWQLWTSVTIVLVSGIALSVFAFAALRQRDRTAHMASIEGRLAGLVARLRETIETPVESANSVAGLFGASNLVERDEFARFADAALSREPLVYALEWAPRVSGYDRSRFEADARADGPGDYEIRELPDDGDRPLVRANAYDEYVPILYMAPYRSGLGFDIASQPERRTLLQQACRTALPVASGRTRLVEDPTEDVAVMVYVPTWARGAPPAEIGKRCAVLQGYVVLVFRVQPIVAAVIRDVPLGDLDLAITDLGAAPPGAVLAEASPGANARIAASSTRARDELRFVDRTWVVEVAARSSPVGAGAIAVLLLGLLVSLLAAVLAGGASLMARLRRRVRQATQLGQYLLEEELGRGGMGIVYRAHHVMMRRPTALKLLVSGGDDPVHQAQFEREVQLTSKLTHPNTIAIYDYGRTADGLFYYVMEYVDGIALCDLIEHAGAQPVARTVHLMRQVLYALREAHGIGLIHRDLTPSNLMISVRGGVADFVKVLDFGLVKELSSEDLSADDPDAAPHDSLDKSGRFFGTPGYTPPEVIVGGGTDARSDLYAVGAIWFALLTGRPAFEGSGAPAIFAAQMQASPRSVRELRPEVPAQLDVLVARCLAREPDERPASVQEILDELVTVPVPEWTGEQAAAWWRDEALRVQTAVRTQRASRSEARTQRTVVIAFGRRSEPASSAD